MSQSELHHFNRGIGAKRHREWGCVVRFASLNGTLRDPTRPCGPFGRCYFSPSSGASFSEAELMQ